MVRRRTSIILYFIWGIFLLSTSPVYSQVAFDYNGNVLFGTINRTSDASLIKVPFRFLNLKSIAEFESLSLHSNLALEVSLSDKTMKVDNREFYLSWYPDFGEFRFGKQINSWGVGSTNSPMDILSPINYYYFFSRGIEKNIGTLSLAMDVDFWGIKLGAVILPQHHIHELPVDDPEMPISIDNLPKKMIFTSVENPLQYGISIEKNIYDIDLTLSYFSGYDKLMTFFGANLWGNNRTQDPGSAYIDTVLSFRSTKVIGAGASSFLGDMTIKSEFSFFKTDDNIDKRENIHRHFTGTIDDVCDPIDIAAGGCEEYLLENLPVGTSADYYQFLVEAEIPLIWDIQLTSQYLKYKLLNISSGFDPAISIDEYINLTPTDNFIPGLGSSIFMFTMHDYEKGPNGETVLYLHDSSVLYLNLKKFLLDHTLEVNIRTFKDLLNKGQLFELEGKYTISDQLDMACAINRITGNKQFNDSYMFNSMENFSHIRVELKYSF
jgi:hypothetical protein